MNAPHDTDGQARGEEDAAPGRPKQVQPPRGAAQHTQWQAWGRDNTDIVLIVDDVPDNLSLLHDALDESGYTVLVATSGQAALQRAAQVRPDIVLLDAMMPGMDGFEVARQLKASAATAHIPIIFMTGLTETEGHRQGRVTGQVGGNREDVI